MGAPEKRTPGGGQAGAETTNKHRNSKPVGGFKSIPSAWWLTPEFRGLNATAQRLLTMLWSSPQTPLCGIVEDEPAAWAARLDITPGAARSALAALYHAGFADIEPGEPLVGLLGHIEAQLRGMPNQNAPWAANTQKALERLPELAVVRRFRERYGLPKKEAQPRGYAKGYRGPPGGGVPRGSPRGRS